MVGSGWLSGRGRKSQAYSDPTLPPHFLSIFPARTLLSSSLSSNPQAPAAFIFNIRTVPHPKYLYYLYVKIRVDILVPVCGSVVWKCGCGVGVSVAYECECNLGVRV